MKRTLNLILLASITLFAGSCFKTTYSHPVPAVDKGKGYISKIDSRKIFYASTITYGTNPAPVIFYDTLSIYVLNDSTISFRNDTLHYTSYSVDTIHNTLTMGLSQWAATQNGNINSATFTLYYTNDSVSYFYKTQLYPLFTSGYEVSMHTL